MDKLSVLIFDWDGTLVDSLMRIIEAMHMASDNCGVPRCTDDEVRAIIGLAMPQAYDVLYPDADDAELKQRFIRNYSDQYILLEEQPSAFYPGVMDALEAYRSAGYQLAVATGKSRRGLHRVLSGHGMVDYFEITRCADETRSKPDPLMLHEILKHCSATPEQAIMVGDSPFDLRMAHNANMSSVAVSYGAQPLSVLELESPLLAIDHFSELTTWLQQQPKTLFKGG
ncbi:MAG TPA: HAD-IA family hydrolase [Gammaproteobacteria bacterium]|nr:HAD-IA family hydrolase [Gammaproteobacteria bacterium]